MISFRGPVLGNPNGDGLQKESIWEASIVQALWQHGEMGA